MKRNKTLRKVSKKRSRENQIYKKEGEEFFKEHPYCEIRSIVCTCQATCRHHTKGRVGTLFLDKRYWKASCIACNSYLETAEGKKWGYEKGFRLDRIGI